MEKNLYIDASHPNETRIVLKSENNIEDYEYENKNNILLKNNIYLGKVSRIEPSLQAAFLDFGRERHGFLAFNDIQPDYYQIPQSDIQDLKQKEEEIRIKLKEESKQQEEENDQALNEEKIEDSSLSEENTSEEKNDNAEINPLNQNQLKGEEDSKNSNNFNKKNLFPQRQSIGSRRYKIQEVIKPNQIILVQVLKDERGKKGAALTTFISLAGKYIVLMPNTPKGGGISRKIVNPAERKKIRNILNEIEIPKEMGLIVRTAGLNKSKNEIDNDLKTLVSIWEDIKNNAVNSLAPSLVYEESDIIKRAIRDICDESTKNIFVEGNDGYEKAKNFVKQIMPQNLKDVKMYKGKVPMFYKEGIEKKLNQIFDSSIKLKSGGYLVINPTEALVSIDVNSGKSTREINIERTALATNLEAADEVARQIKIRDLSGLIIIDFIDMLNFNNRRSVERRLREKLKNDRARIQFGRINHFGLFEMSRQRLRESSVKWDLVLTLESFSFKILKLVEEQALENKVKNANIVVCEQVGEKIKNNFSDELDYCKKKFNLKLNFDYDNSLVVPEYKIHLLDRKKKIVKTLEYKKSVYQKDSKQNSFDHNLNKKIKKFIGTKKTKGRFKKFYKSRKNFRKQALN